MKWVGTDKWLTLGFCPAYTVSLLGLRTGQVSTICHHSEPLCGRVSVATASAVAIVCRNSMAHIFIAGLLRARNRNKLIHTSSSPIWLAWHISKEQKKNILACWKSWEKLGRHGDRVAKPTWAIKLRSDVNLGLPLASQAESPLHTADTN